MADINEILKGVGTFIFVSFLFFFAWNPSISPLLDFLTSTSVYLGAIGWVTFIMVYALTGPLFLIFSTVSASKSSTSVTKPLEVFKGIGIWVFGMVIITLMFMIFFGPNGTEGIVPTLVGVEINGTVGSLSGSGTSNWSNSEVLDVIDEIGSLMVVIAILLVSIIPMYFILQGYGLKIKMGGKSVAYKG